ncbi:uncharacterized protein CC84DRAFT_1162960 [Paraphaeosphaeria sporulosa]|uniref:Uncharacterized protein n=1 Tax=Paraphaeosphaeria sporulosa TaxID=1460663 RepID=A0A177CG79_9PLEO|nr:uncharacterized protein CC84DRAFT_1162960 [Paraphaeosphaeria sporulosa]OAG06603.1 hypothetical protein CC84DRAFT_1162960 [Paraphaeosphaeria sporulosa]
MFASSLLFCTKLPTHNPATATSAPYRAHHQLATSCARLCLRQWSLVTMSQHSAATPRQPRAAASRMSKKLSY